MAEAPNYTLAQALTQYNNDQAQTTNMWYISPGGSFTTVCPEIVKMQIYGKGFEVPNRENTFEDVNYRGYKIPTPVNLNMTQDHNIDIIADVAGDLRRAFLKYQAAAIDPRISIQEASFAADRRPTAGVGGGILRLCLLAPDSQTATSTFTFYGVRVATVGTTAMTNDAGAIATFQVGFKSVYWELDGVDDAQNPGHPVGGSWVTGGDLGNKEISAVIPSF